MVDQIRERLSEALKPVHLEVADESHMHSVPAGAESHFNVFVVSEAFDGTRAVARHQAVYRALAAEMAGSLHALTLKTMAPAEWTNAGSGAVTSPKCLGASKAET